MMRKTAMRGSINDYDEEIRNIDETFQPDDIPISKTINCIWETSD